MPAGPGERLGQPPATLAPLGRSLATREPAKPASARSPELALSWALRCQTGGGGTMSAFNLSGRQREIDGDRRERLQGMDCCHRDSEFQGLRDQEDRATCIVAIAHHHHRVRPLSFALTHPSNDQITLWRAWCRLYQFGSCIETNPYMSWVASNIRPIRPSVARSHEERSAIPITFNRNTRTFERLEAR